MGISNCKLENLKITQHDGLLQVDFVNDHNAEEVKKRPHFQALTPLYPDERIKLETETQNYSCIMDLVTPIGLRSTWFNSGAT